MKKLLSLLGLLTLGTIVYANGAYQYRPNFSRGGVFAGLGGSYNSVKVDRSLTGTATTNVYTALGVLAATGSAGGPTNPYHETQSTFAPLFQLGYVDHLCNSCWLWGVKSTYRYLGLTSTENGLDSFQTGSFTIVGGTTDNFTGHFVISSAQTSINHEIALIPFFGHAYKDSYAYFGFGPVVYGTKYNIYGATGYADINGGHTDVTGAPTNFYNTKWVWGAVAQVGVSYTFAPTLFLDICYGYAVTGQYGIDNAGAFSNTLIQGATTYTESGNAVITTDQRLTTQSFSITLNKLF